MSTASGDALKRLGFLLDHVMAFSARLGAFLGCLRSVYGRLRGCLGVSLGASGGGLMHTGASWVPFGSCHGLLAASWGFPGVSTGCLRASKGVSSVVFGASGGGLMHSGASLCRFAIVFGGFLGTSWGPRP